MITYICLILLFNAIYALQPSCSTCKHFISNKMNNELGLCNMFPDTVYNGGKRTLIKNLAIHCRNDENLCGKKGYLYEPKFKNNENNDLSKELKYLEKEFSDIFEQMKKHNTIKIYKTPRQMYKFFKK
jgi:hypothetical protein